ncbi:5829_t:CDS:1 [Ambispora leptoticha]|uniref:5829_t:CDS:1 n=1 Tax=Ambispora leptoticha TaxID=144679 RepID=A0A9N9HHS5_9GLOM|nr:5829_t:CDS:1 [Ambispora leptoticha]
MDHSWCTVCDKHIFAIENLYCSESCRRKDGQSISSSPSIITNSSIHDSFYEFPRCSSQKPYQSLYSTPESSSYTSPSLLPSQTLSSSSSSSYFDPREDGYYSSSPSNYLYSSSDDLSMSPPSANFTMGGQPFSDAAPITNPALLISTPTMMTTSKSSKKRSFTDSARRLFFF